MCSVAAAGLVIGIVTAVGSGIQQDQQQKKTVKYQNQVTAITQANAAKAAQADYIALAEQTSQVRQAAAQDSLAASREAELARSELTVGAVNAGLEGGVVDDLRSTLALQASQDAEIRSRNVDWQEAQIRRQITAVETNQRSRANSRFLGPVPGIDYASLLGTLASSTFAYAGRTQTNPSSEPSALPDPTES